MKGLLNFDKNGFQMVDANGKIWKCNIDTSGVISCVSTSGQSIGVFPLTLTYP